MKSQMTDHERYAMYEAYEHTEDVEAHNLFVFFRAGWEASQKYDPPKTCDVNRPNTVNTCELSEGHQGDHRYTYEDGSYVGWPRKNVEITPRKMAANAHPCQKRSKHAVDHDEITSCAVRCHYDHVDSVCRPASDDIKNNIL